MGYRNLRQCVEDLHRHGQLVALDEPVDGYLEVAEIQRRVFAAGGPAVWFRQVKNCRFSLVSNLFGTAERMRFIFRDTLETVRRLIQLKADPAQLWQRPWSFRRAPWTALNMLPRRRRWGPVLGNSCRLSDLPQITSWPRDGGPFVTLPAVYSESTARPGWQKSNLGMYRVQLSGNRYQPDRQVGLHYQIHRGIGVHHAEALSMGRQLPVNIFIGGAPALPVAAVMPLPEGMPELSFAGALAGHRIPLVPQSGGAGIYGEADFCITGRISGQGLLPEGPFGDHLGYYSLTHDFPVLEVEHVYHRPEAIWPFTVVGRPPQEDTMFGQFIHDLTGPVIPTVVAGVKSVHAVDAAGVHPLMLAIGSERYVPYEARLQPREVLTQANAILGQGQMSLAKYLLIVAHEDCPELDIHHIDQFFTHLLERIDWARDVHFQTCTTIDTLDYSGTRLNEGSKVVWAAVGPVRRQLPAELNRLGKLPDGFGDPQVVLPGVLAVTAPPWRSPTADGRTDPSLSRFCGELAVDDPVNQFPLVVLVDDSQFVARSLQNFLWVVFTRSNPASDIDGVGSFVSDKHWGCRGSLVIDARIKAHHAPPLEVDPETSRRVDALATRSTPLSRFL
ncbi:MAG: UbiD family decarboxylase [Pirellulales bacterium]